MLSLTKEEVTLLLQVSTMDVYTDYSGGPDTAYESCPLCRGVFCEDDKVSKHVSEEYFNRNILPTIQEEISGEWGRDYVYGEIRIYMIDSKLIPFPHEEGCKIEVLKALHKKMQDFVGTKD